MTKRKSISKKTRFEVFKRDGFSCVYCGAMPPDEVLEVDHIIPVSKGGDNKLENLVCSCFTCNRGKSNNDLTSLPQSLISKHKQEKIDQYAQYIQYVKDKRKLLDSQIQMVSDVYESFYEGYEPNAKFKSTIGDFIHKIGLEDTIRAMEIACMRSKEHYTYKYFCGVCWNIYKQNNEDYNYYG